MKFYVLFIALCSAAFANAQSIEKQPKLIVGIVIDQMRDDFLHRYANRYTEGGFKRLMREGFYGANHHFSYMPTTTGPGHASVYAGTTPSVHGIVGNNWYDPALKRKVYCSEDKAVRTVGAMNAAGQMSPKNLQTTTITDELRLFWNMRSKVVGVSIKDRGAILPAGHLANAAYWLSDKDFISSTYYMDTLPEWVQKFNAEKRVAGYLSKPWETLYPASTYLASAPDNSPYEILLEGESSNTLPRDLSALREANGPDLIKLTPFVNTLCVDMALAAIANEGLGKDAFPDFLALSFSGPDYMGHSYGTRAVEIEDMYLRLDLELARLFESLDQSVGKGQYVVFLTADHGAADVAQFNIDLRLPGGYVSEKGGFAYLKTALDSMYNKGWDLIEKIEGNELYLNRKKLAAADLELDDVTEALARIITGMPGVYAAYPTEIIRWNGSDEFPLRAIKRGLHPDLAGDVIWVLDSGWMEYGPRGTTHGSPWAYDTHIPFLIMGPGVKQGRTFRETHIRDIASTLSALLHIPLPSGNTGQPIVEAVHP